MTSERRRISGVIHSVGNRRPELETYRYDMAGEENITQRELGVYDLATRQMVAVDGAKFKDQNIALWKRPEVRVSGPPRA